MGRGGAKGENPWKDIRRRFQETRIVFRPGKLVIDTAARTSPELSCPPPECFSSTAIKTYLPELEMLTTSAVVAVTFVITVAHAVTRRVRKLIRRDAPRTSSQSLDLSSVSLLIAGTRAEESWRAAKHRFASPSSARQYIFIIRLIARAVF